MPNFREQVRDGITTIQPYVPGLTDDELKHKYGLSRVIKLNANENALGPSPLALDAIREELGNLHHYPDGGSSLLKEAIADFHGVHKDNVLVGNGSDDLIKLISEAFLAPGDEIVVPFPSFSQYEFGAQVMEARVTRVPLNDDFTYDVESLARAVTSHTKFIYLCSPNNPTGTILTKQEMYWLLEHLPAHVIVIVDLAYNDYSTNPERVMEDDRLLRDGRVVFLHTFSKLYGLAGLRVGYGIAHPDFWSFVNLVREPFNVNRVAQRAAVAALKDEAHRKASIQLAVDSKAFYATAFAELGFEYVPTEANFIFVKTGDGVKTMRALMEQGVMVRAGFAGVSEYVRITFGTPEENEACVQALKSTVKPAMES
jgi:histidinol-phosphate aminotransferase